MMSRTTGTRILVVGRTSGCAVALAIASLLGGLAKMVEPDRFRDSVMPIYRIPRDLRTGHWADGLTWTRRDSPQGGGLIPDTTNRDADRRVHGLCLAHRGVFSCTRPGWAFMIG